MCLLSYEICTMRFYGASSQYFILSLQTYEYVMQVALPAASRAAGQVIDKVTIIVDLGTWGLMDMPKASLI